MTHFLEKTEQCLCTFVFDAYRSWKKMESYVSSFSQTHSGHPVGWQYIKHLRILQQLSMFFFVLPKNVFVQKSFKTKHNFTNTCVHI